MANLPLASSKHKSHANSPPNLEFYESYILSVWLFAVTGELAEEYRHHSHFMWKSQDLVDPLFQVLLNFLYKGNENVLYLIHQHITKGLVITQRAAIFCLCFSYYCGAEISKHIFYDLFIADFRDDSEGNATFVLPTLQLRAFCLYLFIPQKNGPAFY